VHAPAYGLKHFGAGIGLTKISHATRRFGPCAGIRVVVSSDEDDTPDDSLNCATVDYVVTAVIGLKIVSAGPGSSSSVATGEDSRHHSNCRKSLSHREFPWFASKQLPLRIAAQILTDSKHIVRGRNRRLVYEASQFSTDMSASVY